MPDEEHHYATLKYESAPLTRSKQGYLEMITLVSALSICALVLSVVVKRSAGKKKLISMIMFLVIIAVIAYLILHYIYKNDSIAEIKNAHKSSVHHLAFSHDNKFVFSSGADGKLKLWSFPSFKYIRTIAEEPFVINDFALSKDGKFIAITSGNLKLIDIKSGKIIKEFNVDAEHKNSILKAVKKHADKPKNKIKIVRLKYNFRTVAISSDNKLIAGTTNFGTYLWNIKSGKLLHKLERLNPAAFHVAFSNNDQQILLMLRLSPSHAFSVKTGKIGIPLAKDLYINAEKRYFALKNKNIGIKCDYYDGLVVFRLRLDKILKHYEGVDEFINSVTASSDGRYILTGGLKNSITLWEYNP